MIFIRGLFSLHMSRISLPRFSLFVLVPGRSLADAFKIGEEIRDAVTADNPKPMKLKLEKVRHD